MTTTSSAVLVEPRLIDLWDFSIPEIGPDAALLKVEATGICGSDWGPYNGTWMTELPPLVLGHEVVGRVVEIGADAMHRWGVAEGDRVVVEESIPCGTCRLCRTGRYHMCDPLHTRDGLRYGLTPASLGPHIWGGFGEHLYVHPRSIVHRMADSVPVEQAPLFIPISNGIRWVERDAGTRIGDTVVIFGPGQHGLGCVLGARLAGAGTVIVVGTRRDKARFEVAKALGADHVIDVADGPAAQQVAELTNGELADVVIEVTSGSATVLADAVDSAAVGATVVVAGSRGMAPAIGFSPDTLFLKELTLKGVYGHDFLSVRRAIELIESGREPLEKLCTHTFPLHRADEALRTLGGETDAPDAIHITVLPDR
ncbi:MAG TPA: zinc-binding dehydrogenase [Pseudonocardia sp.]|jgi:threonine dehydrogenase-like Zn-dependent dehydrogenase|nr:zinc-binding dehydrogenase [Pseudonocardia sp.]